MNPLLTNDTFPAFSKIKPQDIEPALDQVLQENRKTLLGLLNADQEYTWETLMLPLEVLSAKLHKLWSPVSHLHAVMDTQALRDVYNRCLPKLTDYATEVSQNETLYQAIRSIKGSAQFNTLTQAQRKTIDNALRDFRLSGVDLPAAKKEEYARLQKKLSQLTTAFSQNVLDATQAWSLLITDKERLAGLNDYALSSAKEAAAAKGQQGYLLTLEFPSYLAVMQYAKDRGLRQTLYEAYVTRASECGPDQGKYDNSQVMLDILKTRHALARLLTFDSYAHYSLATKMADSPEEVLGFLQDLAKRSKPLAEKDMKELRAFAKAEQGCDELQPWDMPYYSEKLREQRFDISDEAVRPYFPITKVMSGLFKVLHTLYGISIVEKPGVDVWHEDVTFFEVRDQEGHVRGYFYTDLYVREHKRGGAWMDDCQTRRKTRDGIELPIAFVVCNFGRPLDGKPALLTHDDVITLFHEFGHAFHHLLTTVECLDVAGINGVAWDAVELPSQFMENWCWQPDVMSWISGHYETGESLPDDLFHRLLNAKHYQSGLQMMRQLEFALFDFRLHQEFNEAFTIQNIQAILEDVRSHVAVVPRVEYNRFQHGFTHVFGGGYAAGYYSYKWAEVLSSDAFAKFEESGLLESEAGLAFLQHILEQGGSEDMKLLYRKFRGRDATIDALLRHSGITQN